MNERIAHRATLGELFAVFSRYANLTFGGGSATIAVLRGQILTARKWISESEFDLAYGLSRLTPGTNLLAFCTAVGSMARGGFGAVVALVAASLPCSVLAIVATHFFEVWQHSPMFRTALGGALAAAVAIMANTAWVLAEPHAKAAPLKAALIPPAAVALVTWSPLSPFQVLLIAAVCGALWPAKATT
jgi:chromate transporter